MTCSLSTHVLDTAAGKPAAGVAVELAGPDGTVATAKTDGDGGWKTRRYVPAPFFTRVELQVELADGHYHVPLLVSPYGCASYRGS